ncbi:MAG: hypothetical protein DRQ51_01400 [Gammaproteobacteria bacterium]|nr:MAG: hypothetical protein DRQ51_01400 [Gammaproteobacteria bacterium]
MTINKLPVKIDPFKMCLAGESLQGVLLLRHCRRLKEYLSDEIVIDDDFVINVRLDFSALEDDNGSHFFVKGKIVSSMPLICNRCLQSFMQNISVKIDYLIFKKEDKKQENYIVMPDNEPIHLLDFIEDELILSIALSPKHKKIDDCDDDMLKYLV